MQSLDRTQLWCPGQSLWSLITEHVPGFELSKIHTALGYSLVDMYTEVHTEAEMWYKIWRKSQQGNSSSRAGTSLPRQQASLLADPPAVKELVRAEVKMLLQTLRERASGEGRVAEELLFRYKPETVDYALSHLDSCYRSPGDTESRSSSRCSVQSNAEDEIEATRDKLNVTDIDQVVDRLRSFLMEECEALNRLVKDFKGNIKQRWQSPCEVDKLEPSLADLKELRGAIQMDLELYPSSLAASPTASSLTASSLTASSLTASSPTASSLTASSPTASSPTASSPTASSPTASSPLKELKSRLRLSAGRRVSDETLQTLSRKSVFRPHPPPPLSHPKPRPPPGAPPSQASASVKAIHSSSLSRIHGQLRSTSASTGPRKTQAPICNRITTSVHANHHFNTSLPGPDRDNMIVQTVHTVNMLSQEQDSAALCRRPPTSCPSLPAKTQRNSPIHEGPLSSHRSIRGSSSECDLERKSSPFWRSRNINAVPSSSRCDAGSYSSSSADYSVSTTGTRNGRQNSTCGSSLVATTVRTDGERSSPLGKDVTHQRSLVATCTHSAPVTINGQFFTSPKRPLESITSQEKVVQETELEFKLHQPVPPSRVST